ncbi:MAG: hypothetical protein ACOYK6_04020 [Chthoniobacterales bacterium]
MFFLSGCSTTSSEPVEQPSSRESVRLRSLQEQKKSSDQAQRYPSQPWVDRSTRSHQQFSSAVVPAVSYPTRSFFGIKNSLMGERMVPVSEVSLFSQQRVRVEKKVFPTALSSTKMYPLSQKKTDGIMTREFFTHSIQLAPKAQGALDRESSLQQNSKKNFNVNQVRALLDKEI